MVYVVVRDYIMMYGRGRIIRYGKDEAKSPKITVGFQRS